MARLICGYGYLGARVARLWQAEGEQVWVITRSPAKAAKLVSMGFSAVVGDITDKRDEWVGLLPGNIESVLFCVGYDRQSVRPMEEVYAGGLRNVLNATSGQTCRWIYISSTGVYGTTAGTWVDEETPPQPAREGGKAALAAEQELTAHPQGQRSIILRLAGIYGPGRIPRRDDLLAGRPIGAPAEGWLNLIHVEDAARMVLLADRKARAPNLYVVSDGAPVVRADYYRELARLLGACPPTFVAPDPGSPAALRAASDKRVRTDKLQRELSPQFLYPSYKEGLAAIVASEGKESQSDV